MTATTNEIMQIALAAVYIGFAALVLYKIYRLEAQTLSGLICEPDGKASLSRFQLLLFTFVIAGLFMVLSIELGAFIDVPNGVLGLLGISGGSYVISKGVGKGAPPPKSPETQLSEKPPENPTT